MKVLHVVATYYPAFKYGGPINSTHQINKKLVEKGIEVTVFTTMDGQPSSTKANIPTYVDGVKVYYYDYFFGKGYGVSWNLFVSLLKKMKEFDIVLVTSAFTFVSFMTPLISLLKQKPYLISSRGTLDPLNIEAKSTFIKKMSLFLYERFFLNHASTIIVLMEDEKKWLRELDIHNERVSIIPNGIDCYQEPLKKYIANENVKFLYLGRLNYKKNIDLIIKAYSALKKEFNNIDLTIAGPDGGMEQSLKKLTKELNLTNDINFIGVVTGEAKQDILNKSDIFLLPSVSEGISMAQLEAMCSQCAVLVGNRGGIHEELIRHEAGIVINPNLDELYSAMHDLIRNRKLREKISKNGYQLVKEEYSWDSVIDDYIHLYQNIIEKKI